MTGNATIAAMTALWGLQAGVTGPRTAVAIAGLVLLATPFLLRRHEHVPEPSREPMPSRL